MKCVTCGKEIEKDDFDLVKGVDITCCDCHSKISHKVYSEDVKTKISAILYVISSFIFLVGLIIGIWLGNIYEPNQANSLGDFYGSVGVFNILVAFYI